MATKADMDRCGLFSEMGYISIGDQYKSSSKFSFNDSASQGKQMLTAHSKIRCAMQDGFFEKKYARMFEGEGYSDVVKTRRLQRLDGNKYNITSKAFLPSSGNKDICGLGNYYGSFAGVIAAFSPGKKTADVPKTSLRNVQTNPGKKGTGYGYMNICIAPYPEYQSDQDNTNILFKKEMALHKTRMKGGPFLLNMHPQSLFEKNPFTPSDRALPPKKWRTPYQGKNMSTQTFRYSSPGKFMSGDKTGTFDKYPTHSVDTYNPRLTERPVNVMNKTGKLFYPNAFGKTRPVNSISNQNVLKEMNVQNYREYTNMSAAF